MLCSLCSNRRGLVFPGNGQGGSVWITHTSHQYKIEVFFNECTHSHNLNQYLGWMLHIPEVVGFSFGAFFFVVVISMNWLLHSEDSFDEEGDGAESQPIQTPSEAKWKLGAPSPLTPKLCSCLATPDLKGGMKQ